MTALEDAKAALAQGELNAEVGAPVTWSEVRALHGVIRRLVADHEALRQMDDQLREVANRQIGELEAEVERLSRVTDEQIEAAQDAFHEFIFGFEGPLTRRDKSITRQGWRVALEAARNV